MVLNILINMFIKLKGFYRVISFAGVRLSGEKGVKNENVFEQTKGL